MRASCRRSPPPARKNNADPAMARLVVILIVLGLIAAGAAWLTDNDGTATFVMAGYEWRMSTSIAVLLAVLLAIAVAFLIWLLLFLVGGPARLGAWSTQRRARKFFQSLSHGLIAAAAGDAGEASHFARRTEKLMRGQPLALLLLAQAGELSGEEDKQEAAYHEMLKYPETEFLGLRGLFELALRRHDEVQALVHATRAYALKPKAWALNAMFDVRVSRREWREAVALVVQATRNRALSPEDAKRRRAVLLAAQAIDAERSGDTAALEFALEALALAPGLTAPALIAARHLTAQGQIRKAEDVIEAAWAEAPHRDLARAYAAIRPGDSKEARAERLIGLAKLNPMHRESRMLLAEENVALNRWDEAHSILAPLAEDRSSARVCSLMADIAQGQEDAPAAQLWRSRAARGTRLADWRCLRCCGTASEWGPVCPRCGAFDSLRWTAPELAPAAVPLASGAPVPLPAPEPPPEPAEPEQR
jgi:HemY protein